jgi:hypothetical protein
VRSPVPLPPRSSSGCRKRTHRCGASDRFAYPKWFFSVWIADRTSCTEPPGRIGVPWRAFGSLLQVSFQCQPRFNDKLRLSGIRLTLPWREPPETVRIGKPLAWIEVERLLKLKCQVHCDNHVGVNFLATLRAAVSSVSRATFCASMTSPATRSSLGMKHQPTCGRPALSNSVMFADVPCRIRYLLPVWQPMTSKYLWISYCASCCGDNHSFRSLRPRTSASFNPASRHQRRTARKP